MLRFDDRLAPEWVTNTNPSQKDRESSTDDFWRQTFETVKSQWVDAGDEQNFKSFLLSMIALDPDQRLTAVALLNHPYLAGVPSCADVSA